MKLPDPAKVASQIDKGFSETSNKLSNITGKYSNLTTKVGQLTGNIIKLPTPKSGSVLANILTGSQGATNVLETLAGNQNGKHVQISSANPQPEAFNWVEFESVPADFVSYDSVLLFFGAPIYADNAIGSTYTPIGVCQNFSMSSSVNVTAVQELRCEEQIILPGKTQPISISIGRLCGNWDNLLSRVHGAGQGWKYSMQYDGMRDLFGLLVMVMDTSRRNVISQFYLERCAITNWNFAISAGQYQVIENVSMLAGRVVDPSQDVEDRKAIAAAAQESQKG